MRRALIVLVVGAAALALGAAVAGRPRDVASDVVSSRLPKAVATTTLPVTTSEAMTSTTRGSATSSTSTSTSTSTTSTTTSAPAPPPTTLLPQSAVRLVVANATNVGGLAARTVTALRPLGYTYLVATDAIDDRADTVVVHTDGRSGEALRLAAEIGLDPARVRPRQAEDLTVSREDGDVWLLLGADRV